MATYSELAGMMDPSNADAATLREKVFVATLVKAETIRLEADDATEAVRSRKRFSQLILRERISLVTARSLDISAAAFENNAFEAVYRAVLISNRSASLSQINNATDAQIQSAVDDVVDHLAAQYPSPAIP